VVLEFELRACMLARKVFYHLGYSAKPTPSHPPFFFF
jgi:hypothetical protein